MSNISYILKKAWIVQKTVVVFMLLMILFSVVLSILQLFMIPQIAESMETNGSLHELLGIILFFTLSILVVGGFKAYFENYVMFGRIFLRSHIDCDVQEKFNQTSFCNTEDTRFIEQHEKANKAVAGNNEATEAIWETLTTIGRSIIGFIIYLFILKQLNWIILLMLTITSAIDFMVAKKTVLWKDAHRQEEAAASHKLRYLNKQISGRKMSKDIRVFSMKDRLNSIYNDFFGQIKKYYRKCEKRFFASDIIHILLIFSRNLICYGYLLGIVIEGKISIAQFLLCFFAINGFTDWIDGILNSFSDLNRESLDIGALREFLEYKEVYNFEGNISPISGDGLYRVELQNVSFRYPGTDKNILSHLNLIIEPGEKLAIVGLNGAGKTTLIKVLCGLYDPTEGIVLLNNQDIRQFNRRNYYLLFSAVFQKFSLLAGSIAENIAQSSEEVNVELVEKCILKSDLSKKIFQFEKKYNQHMGKEVYDDAIEFSGGELQRLMLARALYKNGPIIILDEPTAALDPFAEQDVYERYSELTEGCTSIFISHRLASTKFCDRIILIEDGQITQKGTHEQLVNIKGKYSYLYSIQSQYYQEEAE